MTFKKKKKPRHIPEYWFKLIKTCGYLYHSDIIFVFDSDVTLFIFND